jgi:uncharacterized membrane-anchored protein YjiN (DUF445 family)
MRVPNAASQGEADVAAASALARRKALATGLVVLFALGYVAAQVKSWDTQQAVRTIELSIGADLQYIRINGALVGGLIGLALFTATRFAVP